MACRTRRKGLSERQADRGQPIHGHFAIRSLGRHVEDDGRTRGQSFNFSGSTCPGQKCRMMGSAALDLAYVATGRFDAYIERSVNWWDIAAGVLWSIVPVDGWLSLQAQFKRETVGDCVERKNRPRSTHQDISMSLLESVAMRIAPLEIHFPKIGAECILENITLAGGLLPGHRIVSFVRNTITFVLSETRGQNDQTYLLTNALVSLFFSDAPNHAIDFFGG